jgi:hypothetical protein
VPLELHAHATGKEIIMTFDNRLRGIIAPLASAPREDDDARLVALRAPHLLRRFARIAASLSPINASTGRGQILARRGEETGYRSVEFRAPELFIVFDAENTPVSLRWKAGGRTGALPVTRETTDAEIDRTLLDAVDAFVASESRAIPAQ